MLLGKLWQGMVKEEERELNDEKNLVEKKQESIESDGEEDPADNLKIDLNMDCLNQLMEVGYIILLSFIASFAFLGFLLAVYNLHRRFTKKEEESLSDSFDNLLNFKDNDDKEYTSFI